MPTCQKPLTPAFAQSQGGAVAYAGTLSDRDVATEPIGRTCGVSRHKLLHGLGFPNDQCFRPVSPEGSYRIALTSRLINCDRHCKPIKNTDINCDNTNF